jgi:hypothetical protein
MITAPPDDVPFHHDAAGFAWEFLRRNPAYRVAAASTAFRPAAAGGAQAEGLEIVTAGMADAAARVWGLDFRGTPRCPCR